MVLVDEQDDNYFQFCADYFFLPTRINLAI